MFERAGLTDTVDRATSRPVSERLDFFIPAALAVHLIVVLAGRTVAWPEVTTPAYLASRGMLLYRDIKVVHTPGLLAVLAFCFRVFGVSAGVVRGVAALGPLVAHAFVLRETRAFTLPVRILTSAFFLVLLLDWNGNAIWPTVLMSALALPIASALSRGRIAAAGRAIGAAILIKQTAAYVLLACVARLLVKKSFREIPPLVLWASLPYAATACLFFLLGAGESFLKWTLYVPFVMKGNIDLQPTPGFLVLLLAAALPLIIEAWLEKPGEYGTQARWLLVVALGFLLMSYPRFGLMQTVACIPCLAVGAARLMSRAGKWLKPFSYVLVASVTLTRGAVVLVGQGWDSKVVFWNDDPAFNKLVDRIEAFPRDAPLWAQIWPNILPRTRRLPPGRIYYHPWAMLPSEVDSIGERTTRESLRPGTIYVFVRYGPFDDHAERVGPFAILQR
jgi:hypothetical protein